MNTETREYFCDICEGPAEFINMQGDAYCEAHKKSGCFDIKKQQGGHFVSVGEIMEKIFGRRKDQEREMARAELSQMKAMRELLQNNDLAGEIHCCGLIVGVVDNKRLMYALEHSIEECRKFINGQKNDYE